MKKPKVRMIQARTAARFQASGSALMSNAVILSDSLVARTMLIRQELGREVLDKEALLTAINETAALLFQVSAVVNEDLIANYVKWLEEGSAPSHID